MATWEQRFRYAWTTPRNRIANALQVCPAYITSKGTASPPSNRSRLLHRRLNRLFDLLTHLLALLLWGRAWRGFWHEHLRPILQQTFRRLEARKGEGVTGVPTGYKDFDNLTNSTRYGLFYTIGCWAAALDYDAVGEHWVHAANAGTGDQEPGQAVGTGFGTGFFVHRQEAHGVGRHITDNAADRTGVNSGINAGNGGGYASADTTSVLHLSNSILADNRDLSGGTIPIRIPDCVGKLSLSYSLLGLHQIAKCTLVGDTGTSIIGSSTTIDPGLNSLNDLGQFTRVHSLLISSPAINAGDPAGCSGVGPRLLTIDQHYNDRVRGGICDLGAYESRYSKIFLPAIQK